MLVFWLAASKNEVKVVAATIVLMAYVLGLSILNEAGSLMQTNTKVQTQGTLKTIGVGVYWDQALTNKVASIDWGTIEPGSSVNKTVYIRNEGNAVATLSMATSNWNPSGASTYLALSWNYNGQTVNVNEAIQVKLTLSALSSASGITTFSFDITIIATA